jgi:hypothetical protein
LIWRRSVPNFRLFPRFLDDCDHIRMTTAH